MTLLGLRNDLAHVLKTLDEGHAIAIEAEHDPKATLLSALDGVDAMLAKPLFVIETQEWTTDAIVGRRLLLMGESADPAPDEISMHERGLTTTGDPYVAVGELNLRLPPSVLWGIDHSRQNLSLLFIDSVADGAARYRTIDGSELRDTDGRANELRGIVVGTRSSADPVVLVDGRTLAREWGELRKRREDAGRREEGRVDWDRMDQQTVGWFAGLLDADSTDPRPTIREKLLDGRSTIEPKELSQLTLLLGTAADVRRELQRDVLDLRVIDEESERPSERELVESDNVLKALKRAVRFFATNLAMGEVVAEDLKETSGSLDYLTLREVLVNQIIHQDYEDPTAAGQINIHAEKLTVFNTGYSLVEPAKLLDGGRHQCRNPLIARALRLIGFAEISGSGIRAVHRACQRAGRKAPTFESNRESNSFTLTLDWSEGEVDLNAYWQTFVGVDLTAPQAAVLNALAEVASLTVSGLEEMTGLDTSEMAEALDFLRNQVLVEEDESNYRLADHLREKLG